MAFTAQLGSPRSGLSGIELGLGALVGAFRWQGPFPVAEVFAGGVIERIGQGQAASVPTGALVSDPGWWGH